MAAPLAPPEAARARAQGAAVGLRNLRWSPTHLASSLFLSTIPPNSKCPAVLWLHDKYNLLWLEITVEVRLWTGGPKDSRLALLEELG